jgi:superfamily II DNA/RNA helicase
VPPPPPPPPPKLPDFNALQTRLIRAIEAEDYSEAAKARDALREASESEGRGGENEASSSSSPLLPAWRDLPLDSDGKSRTKTPEWLAQRAEQLGYLYPTDIQRRASAALSTPGGDAVVVAQTGSGKTLAFLMPLLSRLDYGRVEGRDSTSPSSGLPPQLVVVVPTRDLGVQTALLIYRLLGGSFSTR